jgi:glucosamine kinase
VVLLAIDGGGTGCRAVVADAQGRVLARAEGGPANIATDPDGARAALLAAAGAALDRAGGDAARAVAVLGVAGASLPAQAEWLAARLPFGRARVVTDAETALFGAHCGADGVAVTLGTGSVLAVRRAGVFRSIGGWGFVLGDEAGGAWIGRAAMGRALRALDGLVPMTPLLDAILAAEGGAQAMVARSLSAPPADFARHAPAVVAAAGQDAAADSILADADAALVAAIDSLMAEGPLPLCFLGGLGPVFAARLAPRYGTRIRPPAGTALDGALAMARALAAEGAP